MTKNSFVVDVTFKEISEKIGYDNNFFDRCLRTILNKIYSKKVQQHTVPPLFRVIATFSKINFEKTVFDILPCVNLKVVFRIKNTLRSTFKDKISKEM